MKETINQRVAKCRKLANLNQTDVAEKLGMKCSTYSQMERKGIISAERLLKMAVIFGVSPNYLLNGEEPAKQEVPPVPIINPKPDEGTLGQTPEIPHQPKIFVVTKKEESLLKLIRNFSKPNYDRVMKFVETIYKEEKN